MEINPAKTKILVIGGLAGLIIGVLAAFMLLRRSEMENREPSMSATDGVKIGMGLLGILKLVSDSQEKS